MLLYIGFPIVVRCVPTRRPGAFSPAKKLAKCAGSDDYDDDCYSEWRRTKSAYSDYESAVSEVQSNYD